MDRGIKQVEAEKMVTKNANQNLTEQRRKEHIGTSNADLNAITIDEDSEEHTTDDQPEIPIEKENDHDKLTPVENPKSNTSFHLALENVRYEVVRNNTDKIGMVQQIE